MKQFLSGLMVILLAVVCAAQEAVAQSSTWPARPLKLVIPFTPGGGTDILGRFIAAGLESALGQPVVVENVPGANGRVARQQVGRAPSDGYTLMLGSNSTHAISPLMSKEPPAEILGSFAAVSVLANTTLVIAVSADSPIKTLAQLIEVTKAKRLSYGTFGLASSPHLMGELLSLNASAPMLHVPYKGSAPAVTDLLGGHIDSVFLTVAAISKQAAAGKIRPLAITGSKRINSMPDVPTFAEAGVKGLEDAGWFAIFAPPGTPAAITDKLSSALAGVIAQPASQARLDELGLEPVGSSPAQLKTAWDGTLKLVQEIIVRTGLKLE